MLELLVLPFYVAFCLWLGYRILQRAGYDGRWTFLLLAPIINIIFIWYFAFDNWPNLNQEKQKAIWRRD
jgi:hypothetical protein